MLTLNVFNMLLSEIIPQISSVNRQNASQRLQNEEYRKITREGLTSLISLEFFKSFLLPYHEKFYVTLIRIFWYRKHIFC